MFSFDAAGGKYEEADYQANGSGGVHARNWIKAGWREGLSSDDAIELAIRSLFAAADEDVATGGPDLVRGIYPNVAVIDADGFVALTDDDVATGPRTCSADPSAAATRPRARLRTTAVSRWRSGERER